jgi:hypothetical protein
LFRFHVSGVMQLSQPGAIGTAKRRAKAEENSMDTQETFNNSTYEDQIHLAERELTAFILAVTELFGPEEARLSAEEWVDESDLMDSPPRSISRDWRAVTVAASARLASRLNIALRHRISHDVLAEIPYGVTGGCAGVGMETAASSFS